MICGYARCSTNEAKQDILFTSGVESRQGDD